MKNISIVVAMVLLLSSCNNPRSSEGKEHTIAVSVLPQEYFVKKIAGDYFKVNVMIPPGASPATYEPTPVQLASLSRTELYLKMGYTGFELAWMDKLTSTNKDMKIFNLSEGIDLIMEKSAHDQSDADASGEDHHHGGIDPHTWLSPGNAKIIAENTYAALSETYPEMKDRFGSNLKAMLAELDSLDTYISNRLSDLKSRAFFTYHPSLSYFARDYQLDQYPLELGGKTPSAGHMKFLVDTGKEKHIGVIFLQMQFDQKNAEVLADEIDAEIVQINPLDPDWFDQMIFITDKLKENLK